MLIELDVHESSVRIADPNGSIATATAAANHRVRLLLMARLQQLMASRRLT
jgi:hypothetical protein